MQKNTKNTMKIYIFKKSQISDEIKIDPDQFFY